LTCPSVDCQACTSKASRNCSVGDAVVAEAIVRIRGAVMTKALAGDALFPRVAGLSWAKVKWSSPP
jgi:hypothetical protein